MGGAIAVLAAEGFGKSQYSGLHGYTTDPGIQVPSIAREADKYWLT